MRRRRDLNPQPAILCIAATLDCPLGVYLHLGKEVVDKTLVVCFHPHLHSAFVVVHLDLPPALGKGVGLCPGDVTQLGAGDVFQGATTQPHLATETLAHKNLILAR